ncbi:MAG: CDP-alcohol phosphatidyltransferase family protein [Alphaproteobacteria bacterium]|nr:CDP-alcohol phosphatidyltransferase family protein [Alphaproteobacteria bacterium]
MTAIRLVLVPFIAVALLNERFDQAFWMMIAAGASDAVDGYIARAFGHKSLVGAYLDPMADKLLLITTLGILTYEGHLPVWLMALVFGRDVAIVVTVAAFTLMKRVDLRMQPLFISKLTTFAQVALVVVVVANLAFDLEGSRLVTGLIWTVAAATAASWVAYFLEGLRALKAAEARPSA